MSSLIIVPHETETYNGVLNSGNIRNMDEFETVAIEKD
jgi:hypothetical protein